MLFETHSSPAAFIGHSGMFGAFCAGRSTSLVIDMGARETRIIPVVDGFVLRKALMKTSRGGNWLDRKVFHEIESCCSLKPWFEKNGFSSPPITVRRSFRDIHVYDIIKDIKKWMVSLSLPSSLLYPFLPWSIYLFLFIYMCACAFTYTNNLSLSSLPTPIIYIHPYICNRSIYISSFFLSFILSQSFSFFYVFYHLYSVLCPKFKSRLISSSLCKCLRTNYQMAQS